MIRFVKILCVLIPTVVCGTPSYSQNYPGECADYSNIGPQLVNVAATQSEARDIEIVGNWGYVAEYDALTVWNVSDPSDPLLVSSVPIPGFVIVLEVDGDYAYVVGSNITTIDISNPESPEMLSSVALPGASWVLSVFDGIAYAVSYADLYVYDLSDPMTPIHLSTFELYDRCADLVQKGDMLFAAGSEYFQAVDVVNPSSPTTASIFHGVDEIRGMTVVGDYAYFSAYTDSDQGCSGCGVFGVLNISNPYQMEIEGSTLLYAEETGGGVVVKESVAYVANAKWGVDLIDVANPSDPHVIGVGPAGAGEIWAGDELALKDDVVIVASGNSGLLSYKLTRPNFFDSEFSLNRARSAILEDGMIYAGLWGNTALDQYEPFRRLQMIDVSDPTNIETVGYLSLPGYVADLVAKKDDIVYMADQTYGGFYVANIADPAASEVVNHVTTSSDVLAADISGDFMAVGTDSSGLIVYDISTPEYPIIVSQHDFPFELRFVEIVGDQIIVADSNWYTYFSELAVVNWEDPEELVELGSYRPGIGMRILAVHNNLAYVTAGGPVVLIISLEDPSNIKIVSSFNFPASEYRTALSLKIDGNIGYLGQTIWGMHIINFSDPLHPVAESFVSAQETLTILTDENAVYSLTRNNHEPFLTVYSMPKDCNTFTPSPVPTLASEVTRLQQNHPNPFNPKTSISFHLDSPTRLSLKVFDVKGRLVEILVNDEQVALGAHTVDWNARDGKGGTVAAGVYFYRLETDGHTETRKMVLLK